MPPFEPKKGTGMPMDLPPGGPVGAPLTDIPGEEGDEKASLAKVKDLLQQAMDMLGELGANEGAPVEGGMPLPPPGMSARRPPMKPRPTAGPGPMGMM